MIIDERIAGDFGWADGFQPAPHSNGLRVFYDDDSYITEIHQDGNKITLTRSQVDCLIEHLKRIDNQ